MNTSIVRYVLGTVLKMEAALFLLPMLTAAIYQEKQGFAYIITALFSLCLGMIMTRRKPKNNVFYLKEGCVTTSLSWILMSLVGCLPFVMTGEIPVLLMPCLKPSPVLPPPVPVFYQMWKPCPTPLSCGAALPIGWVVWECWFSCWQSYP